MKSLTRSVWACGMVVALAIGGKTAAVEPGRSPLEDIFAECRHRDGPTMSDDLRSYAKAHGYSDEQMVVQLVEIAKASVAFKDNETQRRSAECALWGLALFGDDAETEFVRSVMRETQDKVLRQVAIRVGIRMASSKWEEVAREVATDCRFDNYDRLGAYEEVFRLGRKGNDGLKNQVENVLSEFQGREACKGNQDRLEKWIEELKAR